MSNPAPIIPISQPRKSDEIAKRLVGRRATLKADVEFITGEIADIDSQLLELFDGKVGTHDVDGTKVEIREYSRTDVKWIETEYPADQYPQLYKTTRAVDNDAVKKQFAPAVLDEHKIRGAKSVIVK